MTDTHPAVDNGAVLVVEDDELVAHALAASLTRANYKVALARNLDEARSAFAKRPTDVVVTDLLMPGGTGLELLKWVEAKDPTIPVVIVTADQSIEAAAEAANFILEDCWDHKSLARGFRGAETLGVGFLEDYALAGLGMLRLHAATGDARWLHAAHEFAAAVSTRFYDAEKKAFMQTAATQGELPVRLTDLNDGVLPSGGSAAMMLCLQVGLMSGDDAIYDVGYEALGRSVGAASGNPFSAGYLLQVIDHAVGPVREVVIAGDDEDPTAAALWKTLWSDDPVRVLPIRIGASGAPAELADRFDALEGKRALKGTATAFVCQRGSCQAPTSDPAKLRAQLDKALASAE